MIKETTLTDKHGKTVTVFVDTSARSIMLPKPETRSGLKPTTANRDKFACFDHIDAINKLPPLLALRGYEFDKATIKNVVVHMAAGVGSRERSVKA